MAPNDVWHKKSATNVGKKDLFWRSHQKKILMIFVGENLWAKSAQNFSGKFREIRAKSFAPSKIRLLLRLWQDDLISDLDFQSG